jgi:hypothetical protein
MKAADGRKALNDNFAALAMIKPTLALAVIALTTALSAASLDTQRSQSPVTAVGLAGLPRPAQGPVSAALGRRDVAYWIRDRQRPSLINPAQGLRASFARSGISVRAGGDRLQLGLAGAGYGRPQLAANRVSYRHGGLVEWYANGPLGIEQGFRVLRAPRTGNVTLSLRLGGDLRPALEHGSLIFRSRRGRAVLRYGGLAASDARGRALPASFALRGDSVLLRVHAAGARYPVSIDPFVQAAALTASDGASEDHLGFSVAVSGSTIVAGAPDRSVAGHQGQGVVYVFTASASGSWTNAKQTAELTASDGATDDGLGSSVTISGSTVVAGAPGHTLAGGAGQGAVYVFSAPASGRWQNATQSAELSASDGGVADGLGSSVAISGGSIAAGAPEHTFAGRGGQGAVYVFNALASGRWGNGTQTAELLGSDGAVSDELGYSVAISGSTIAASAPGHAVGNNPAQGAVYVFAASSAGAWRNATQTAELTASDGAANDRLGDSVSTSGSTIAAGAALHAVGANSQQGSVYVFTASDSGWRNSTQTAELTASDGAPGDGLGAAVATTGDMIAAGAPARMVGSNAGQGSVYEFSLPASSRWQNATQTVELSASGGAGGDSLGSSVGLTDTTLVAGAPLHSIGSGDEQGAAYVFSTGASAVQPGAPTLTNVKQSHDRWRTGSRLAILARGKPAPLPVGTTFSFTLNEPAAVRLVFTRRLPGRAVGGKCTARTHRNRLHPACTRTVSAGALSFTGHPGADRVRFQGRVSRSRTLSPGSYSVAITATNTARQSTRPRHLNFSVG